MPSLSISVSQEKPSIRQMEAKNGPYAVSASFSLTNKPVNALWEWSKVQFLFHKPNRLPFVSQRTLATECASFAMFAEQGDKCLL